MEHALALVNGLVVDVDDDSVSEANVVVVGGRIMEVGYNVKAPAGARVIDLGGKAIIPGLIDSHVHLTSVVADTAFVPRLSPYYIAAGTSKILQGMLQRGFTTVRDVGGADWGLARGVEEGLFSGPRVHFGGPAFSQTGGHGDKRTVGDPHSLGRKMGRADGVENLRLAVREELRKGADHIKLFLSGGVAASPTDQYDAPQYSAEEIRVAVQEAGASFKYVTAHAYTTHAVQRGLDEGVRCFEHGNLLDGEGARAMVAAGAYLVPTLSTYDAMNREGQAHGLPANSRWPFSKVLEWAKEALEHANNAGVQIAYGTDLLGSMHVFQSSEFTLRAEVQTAQQILAGATTVAAQLLGRADEIGQVAPGYLADVVIVDGNPLEDITILSQPERNVRGVVQKGKLVHTNNLE